MDVNLFEFCSVKIENNLDAVVVEQPCIKIEEQEFNESHCDVKQENTEVRFY